MLWNENDFRYASLLFCKTADRTSQPNRNTRNVYCSSFTFCIIIISYALQPFKAYCGIWVRRSNFRHQASPHLSPRENTQRRKVELWVRNVREFCLNAEFTFRELLHAVKLQHGTDGFTSPLKEGVQRIFFALKIRRLRPGANPSNLGTKGQHTTSVFCFTKTYISAHISYTK